MKKPILFILLIAAVFTSCSSDDDNSNISEAALIGKWQWTASTENGKEVTLDQCDMMDNLEFKTNGIMVSTIFYSDTVVNNGQTTTTCKEDRSTSGEWSLLGNNITLKFGNESEISKILELTSTIMKFEWTDEYTDQEGNIMNDTYIETYKKI